VLKRSHGASRRAIAAACISGFGCCVAGGTAATANWLVLLLLLLLLTFGRVTAKRGTSPLRVFQSMGLMDAAVNATDNSGWCMSLKTCGTAAVSQLLSQMIPTECDAMLLACHNIIIKHATAAVAGSCVNPMQLLLLLSLWLHLRCCCARHCLTSHHFDKQLAFPARWPRKVGLL
jgi:hypothetical protein